LPFVSRVGFADVDRQKISMILVVVEDLYDVADLATEWRSGKAAEDQDQRLADRAVANVEAIGAA